MKIRSAVKRIKNGHCFGPYWLWQARIIDDSVHLFEFTTKKKALAFVVWFKNMKEENCLGSIPESMQDGDRAQTMQNAVDSLDSAYEAVMDDSCIDIDEALNQLENAKGE